MKRTLGFAAAAVLGITLFALPAACLAGERADASMTVASSAFAQGELIPGKYTCAGDDTSPHISWAGAPPGVESYVLIMDDPDAPRPRPWVHWVVHDIPAVTTSLAAGLTDARVLDNGAKQGRNSWGRIGYGGPCPPSGIHRYHFKVYALDTMLGLEPGKADKRDLEKAMEGHVLARGTLVGQYRK
ncbi:MAG: YbhB/YbcL family Raf kinase inhibitor-like protein [Desulfatibacillaceae bacterium]